MHEPVADANLPAARSRGWAAWLHPGTVGAGALGFGSGALVVALLALAGWVLDLPRLRGIEPAMQPLTAVCMALCAAAVLSLAGPGTPWSRAMGRGAGLLVLVASMAAITATLSGHALPLDTLLLRDAVLGQPRSPDGVPGRMATGTAFCLSLIGMTPWLPRRGWARRVRALAATTSLVVAATTALGFAFSPDSLKHVHPLAGVAAPAALGLALLSFALLLAYPGDSWMGRMVNDRRPSRHVAPVAACVLIPLAIAGLAITGQQLGYYDSDFRLVLTTVGTAAALVCALWVARRWETQSEERFRATFELAPVGIAHVGLDGRWLRVNDRVCDITGRTREQLLGLTFQSITHPDDLPDYVAKSGTVLAGEVPSYARQKRYLRPDGSAVWVNITVSLQRDADGRPLHYISVVEDITERMQVDEALRDAHRQKDEFLAMLAHELRNPLAPISNAGALMARLAGKDGALAQPIAIVNRQARQLARLVDDLLDVSRIAQGRVQLRYETVDLAQVVEQAVEEVQPLVRDKRQQLEVQLPGAPAYVNGDRVRLAQTLGNVLQNAAKYTQAGGHICVSVSTDDGRVAIRIRDNGPGIEPELLPHLFDIFVQSKRTLDRSQGGLGLGLSLCRSLVTMHGGTIEAESAGAQRGAMFTIQLPLHAAPVVAEPKHLPPAGARRRVLVVDDNGDAAESLALLLRASGHEVSTAHDARQALDDAVRLQPDVVLLDIGLPEMDGYEVARRLRNDRRMDATRLVALTGYGQEGDREQARAAGFDDHLLKPADPETLQRLMDERRRAR